MIRLEPGARFGKLTFMRETEERRGGARVGVFVCDCGVETKARMRGVAAGKPQSCGCAGKANRRTHGMRHAPEYEIWKTMIQRCRNPRSHRYSRYGGRGIKVCERWLRFENFYADMGPRPQGCDIHRVENDGDYEPGNCIWLTHEEHARLHRGQR